MREHGNAPPAGASCATRTTAGAKKLGHGEGYVYPHDDPAGFELDYLPEELKSRDGVSSRGRYYRPADPLEGIDLTAVIEYLREESEPGAAAKLEARARSRGPAPGS